MSFKKGDKIRPKKEFYHYFSSSPKVCAAGGWCLVNDVSGDYVSYALFYNDGSIEFNDGFDYYSRFELIPTTSTTPTFVMNLLQSARNLFIGEPEATFRKVGIQDENGNFTDEAFKAFVENLMRNDAKEKDGYLQTLAATLKKEQEENKSK